MPSLIACRLASLIPLCCCAPSSAADMGASGGATRAFRSMSSRRTGRRPGWLSGPARQPTQAAQGLVPSVVATTRRPLHTRHTLPAAALAACARRSPAAASGVGAAAPLVPLRVVGAASGQGLVGACRSRASAESTSEEQRTARERTPRDCDSIGGAEGEAQERARMQQTAPAAATTVPTCCAPNLAVIIGTMAPLAWLA